ncbi:uncharacterized protein LOC127481288 [Manacus candei]|uniref:uncharacterized protein LOC127481288 n=1 Tax=Manacus candei TaxID=415023 RepID=UPI0022272D75|nr:uncharacterized protein LOC127481288 [Manacus candei]
MSHSCAEPGSLSRLRKAPQERKLYIPPQLYAKGFLPPVSAPFLLLGEHEVDGEDPQASAGTRDSYNCDFPPALVKGTSRILLGMYQLSCWSFSMEYLNTKGENGASRQEEEKPRDSSLSPRQPMNCLAGNGGTGWTLHCSLGMCGSPLRNCRNSWCRLGRWIGRPSPSVPAQPLGPCPVVALPALQVKWEGPLQVLWVTFIAGKVAVKGPGVCYS